MKPFMHAMCHNRIFYGSGLAIVRHLLLNNEWVKSIRYRVAYGQATYVRAFGLVQEEGFRKRGQRDFEREFWKQDLRN